MKKIKLASLMAVMISVSAVTANTSVFAVVDRSEITSGGKVEFYPDNAPTDPVDPENPDPSNPVEPWDPIEPDHKPNPGTAGPLSLDFASSIDFGRNKISNKDEVYYAEPQYLWDAAHETFDPETARPNYVQVTDKRGNNAGWTLMVKQEGQFKNETTLNKELTGAEISFTKSVADSITTHTIKPTVFDKRLVPGAETPVMVADAGTGAGTWVDRFGTLEEVEVDGETVKKNTAITLSVPGTTAKDAVRYDTKLLWILTDVPNNTPEV